MRRGVWLFASFAIERAEVGYGKRRQAAALQSAAARRESRRSVRCARPLQLTQSLDGSDQRSRPSLSQPPPRRHDQAKESEFRATILPATNVTYGARTES